MEHVSKNFGCSKVKKNHVLLLNFEIFIFEFYWTTYKIEYHANEQFLITFWTSKMAQPTDYFDGLQKTDELFQHQFQDTFYDKTNLLQQSLFCKTDGKSHIGRGLLRLKIMMTNNFCVLVRKFLLFRFTFYFIAKVWLCEHSYWTYKYIICIEWNWFIKTSIHHKNKEKNLYKKTNHHLISM